MEQTSSISDRTKAMIFKTVVMLAVKPVLSCNWQYDQWGDDENVWYWNNIIRSNSNEKKPVTGNEE